MQRNIKNKSQLKKKGKKKRKYSMIKIGTLLKKRIDKSKVK